MKQPPAWFSTDSPGVAFFTLAADGTVVTWSAEAEDLYGYSAAEALGRSLHFLYFPGDHGPADELSDELKAAASDPEIARERVHRQRHKGGAEMWVALRVEPGDRWVGGWTVAVQDVSRLHRAEAATTEARAALERTREELRRTAGRLLAAQEEEGRRIARELHDDLGQRLAALAFDVSSLRQRAPAGAVELDADLRKLGRGVQELSGDLRRLSRRLHPAALERFGLAGALRGHCLDLEAHGGPRVHLELPEGPGFLALEAALGLYRVAQEALTNVARHAGVREARLTLERRTGEVVLKVEDEGAGFDPVEVRRLGGLGLAGMAERLSLLGGELRVDGRPGRGTVVTARLPLPAGQEELAESPDAATEEPFIGPYRLLEVLRQGALSTVYRAREPEPLAREVALKLHRDTLPGRSLRFAAERRALTRLDHPNVAQVFEAGTTEAGDPYLVMEYVPGEPITTYCDRFRLGLTGRLELFRQICEGVQHAHQKAVLHQDLTPANLLVKEDAGQAQVKIVDFSMAEGLDPGLATGRLGSAQMLAAMPAFLAPELLAGGEADIHSDIYSLGVVLHELLAGAPPQRPPGSEVLPPSSRLGQIPEGEAREVARCRGLASTAALTRALAEELDWIVLRAMAPDPEHRYPTVTALVADVKRYLAGERVKAVPPRLSYRWRKFARRHRVEVGAVLLVIFALAAGWVGAMSQARRAEREAARAAAEEATAEQVSRFLVELFEASDPRRSRGEEITVRDLLTRGAERIASGFDADPLVQARLLSTLGSLKRELGAYEEARPLLEAAVENRQHTPGVEHLEVAESLQELGELYELQPAFGEAEPLYRRALSIREKELGPDHPAVAATLHSLGTSACRRGRWEEARPLLERAATIREGALGPDHPELARTLQSLAGIHSYQGDPEGAEGLLRRALGIRLKAFGEYHPDTAASLEALAFALSRQGREEEARDLLERAVAIWEEVLGPAHPNAARALASLASSYLHLGDLPAAEEAFRRSLAAAESTLGPEHPSLAYPLHSLALTLVRRGKLAEAEPLYRRALELHAKQRPADHPDVVATRTNLAILLRRMGRQEEAAALEVGREGEAGEGSGGNEEH